MECGVAGAKAKAKARQIIFVAEIFISGGRDTNADARAKMPRSLPSLSGRLHTCGLHRSRSASLRPSASVPDPRVKVGWYPK